MEYSYRSWSQRKAIEKLERLCPTQHELADGDWNVYLVDPADEPEEGWSDEELERNIIPYDDVFGIDSYDSIGQPWAARFQAARGIRAVLVDGYFYEERNVGGEATWRLAYVDLWEDDNPCNLDYYWVPGSHLNLYEWPDEVYGDPKEDWPEGTCCLPAPDGVPEELWEISVPLNEWEGQPTGCFTANPFAVR